MAIVEGYHGFKLWIEIIQINIKLKEASLYYLLIWEFCYYKGNVHKWACMLWTERSSIQIHISTFSINVELWATVVILSFQMSRNDISAVKTHRSRHAHITHNTYTLQYAHIITVGALLSTQSLIQAVNPSNSVAAQNKCNTFNCCKVWCHYKKPEQSLLFK